MPQHEDDGEPTLEGCFAPDGTDLTLIEWFLQRTPAERLQTAQSMVDLVASAAVSTKSELFALLRALHDHGVEFVVVGGVAAILEGVAMPTYDVAVVYQVEAANLGRLMTALSDLDATYRDPAGRTIKPNVERLATNRMHLLQTPASILDAMKEIAPSWKFEDLVERSHRVELSGMNLRVLELAAVVESKVATDRPKDRAELFVLRNTLEMRSRQGLST